MKEGFLPFIYLFLIYIFVNRIMKMTELRQKSKEELIGLMRAKQLRRDEIRFLLRQNKTKNVKEQAAIRKDIARIHTLLASL